MKFDDIDYMYSTEQDAFESRRDAMIRDYAQGAMFNTVCENCRHLYGRVDGNDIFPECLKGLDYEDYEEAEYCEEYEYNKGV